MENSNEKMINELKQIRFELEISNLLKIKEAKDPLVGGQLQHYVANRIEKIYQQKFDAEKYNQTAKKETCLSHEQSHFNNLIDIITNVENVGVEEKISACNEIKKIIITESISENDSIQLEICLNKDGQNYRINQFENIAEKLNNKFKYNNEEIPSFENQTDFFDQAFSKNFEPKIR